MIGIENKVRLNFRGKNYNIDVDHDTAKSISDHNMNYGKKVVIKSRYKSDEIYFLIDEVYVKINSPTVIFAFKEITLEELPRVFLAIWVDDIENL